MIKEIQEIIHRRLDFLPLKSYANIFEGVKGYGNLDYAACRYKKAAAFIDGTKIRCALVSTNSIAQGEQVAPLWKNLNVHIDFAYRTFKWQSESAKQAAVHCVIIGFSYFPNEHKKNYL